MDGEAVAMAGASFNHNLIVANVVGALWGRLRGTPCAVVPSDLKVKATSRLYYPDVTVVCGDPSVGARRRRRARCSPLAESTARRSEPEPR